MTNIGGEVSFNYPSSPKCLMYLKLKAALFGTLFILVFALVMSNLNVNLSERTLTEPKGFSIILDTAIELTSDTLLMVSNQASKFNHNQQRNIEYSFVTLIALFNTLTILFYQQVKPVRAPPWFSFLRLSARSRLSGWKESNLLYKAQLTYHV